VELFLLSEGMSLLKVRAIVHVCAYKDSRVSNNIHNGITVAAEGWGGEYECQC
jgi:hypothetical protein